MASIMSDVDCPECGRNALEDFYYKTGELFIYCQNCGYDYRYEIEMDNGEYLKDDNGNFIYIETIINPRKIKRTKPSKRIFSENDPYGEENWDD